MSLNVRYRTLPLEAENFRDYPVESIGQVFFDEDMLENADEEGYAYLAFLRKELPETDDLQFVLFQHQGAVVACGMLIDIDMYDEPDDEGFTGHYVFNASSIVTFKPVPEAQLRACFPGLKDSRHSQELDGAGFDAFVALVSKDLQNIEPEDFQPQAWIRDQLEALEAEGN